MCFVCWCLIGCYFWCCCCCWLLTLVQMMTIGTLIRVRGLPWSFDPHQFRNLLGKWEQELRRLGSWPLPVVLPNILLLCEHRSLTTRWLKYIYIYTYIYIHIHILIYIQQFLCWHQWFQQGENQRTNTCSRWCSFSMMFLLPTSKGYMTRYQDFFS